MYWFWLAESSAVFRNYTVKKKENSVQVFLDAEYSRPLNHFYFLWVSCGIAREIRIMYKSTNAGSIESLQITNFNY